MEKSLLDGLHVRWAVSKNSRAEQEREVRRYWFVQCRYLRTFETTAREEKKEKDVLSSLHKEKEEEDIAMTIMASRFHAYIIT